MNHEEALNRIRALASRLSQVRAQSKDAQGNVGLLLGAVYALARAMILRFEDRTGTALPSDYSLELSGILTNIGRGQLPQDSQWLAGFYFNSGLYRLAATYHRTLKVLTGNSESQQYVKPLKRLAIERKLLLESDIVSLETVHREINGLKHASPSLGEDRPVDIALAVSAAEEAEHLVMQTYK